MSEVLIFFNDFIKNTFSRMAVPLFFIISGAVFFRDYTNDKYIKKLKSRWFSLVIPYLVWNFIGMLFQIITSYTFISNYFVGRERFVISVKNIFWAIFLHGGTPVLWFVFCLIVFVAISPLIDMIVRNQYVCCATILTLLILAQFEIGLPTDLFFSRESIIYYLIGCLIGKRYFDAFSQKSNKKTYISALLIFIITMALKVLGFRHNIYNQTFISVIILTVMGLSLWFASDMFVPYISQKPFMENSFVVYAMHLNVMSCIAKVLYLIFPKSYIWSLPNFILTTLLTLVFIQIFCVIVQKYVPKVYMVLSGNRGVPKRVSDSLK